MKKNIPETPEFIHTMIQSEVKKQLQDTKVVNIQTRRVKKWTGARVAAAINRMCIGYIDHSLCRCQIISYVFRKTRSLQYRNGELRRMAAQGKLIFLKKFMIIDISAGYIPEGMEWIDEFHLEYPEHDRTGGFSFASVLLDEDDLSKVMQDKNVVDCEERTFGNYEGVYLKYNDLAEDGSFNQRIYLLCQMYIV